MKISERITGMASSPIRKLTPLADKAKAEGVRIYHLNIGQPDIKTPSRGLESLRKIDRTVLEYSPSQGFLSLRKKISEYYADCGMDFTPDEITVTTGASEAVLFAFLTCMDPGDELITTEPTYANYLAFADVAGVKVKTLKTRIEDGFALPGVEHFEELITSRTRAILICNPNENCRWPGQCGADRLVLEALFRVRDTCRCPPHQEQGSHPGSSQALPGKAEPSSARADSG